MFLKSVISMFSTKWHYSSTMANGIGRSHRVFKQNIKQPGVTRNKSNQNCSTSNSHDNSNGRINVVNESSLSADRYFSKNSDVHVSAADIILTPPVSRQHKKT